MKVFLVIFDEFAVVRTTIATKDAQQSISFELVREISGGQAVVVSDVSPESEAKQVSTGTRFVQH